MRTIKFRIFDSEIKKYINISASAIMLDELNNLKPNLKIEQFTGLYDKNGKEIYEGDIVKFHYFYQCVNDLGCYEAEKEIISVIEERDLGLYLRCKNEEDGGYLLFFNRHEESFEIIGNIHETPELLK